MNTRTTLSTIAALGLLSLTTPALAQAAPAKLAASPTAGGVTVKVTNPNRYGISGTVALVAGKKTVASKRASVAAKRSRTITLPGSGLRSATLVTKLGRRGSKATVSRRTVTFGGITAGGGLTPSSIAAPAPGRASVPSSGTPNGGSTPPAGNGGGGGNSGGGGGNPPPPVNTHWTATDLTNGGDFGLEVKNGQLSLDGSYLMPVFCQAVDGRWAWSYEVIDEYQNWALGNQYGTRYRDTPRVNMYAGSSDHRVTYKITSQQNGNQITGTISQSFAAPRYENGHSVIFDCSGSLSYSATQ